MIRFDIDTGAASTEYFIAKGYAVVFLHRIHSLLPYSRRFAVQLHKANILDFLTECPSTGEVHVISEFQEHVKTALLSYENAKQNRMLLSIPFLSVQDYLFLLRAITVEMQAAGKSALIYAAAAVSDYFLPRERTVRGGQQVMMQRALRWFLADAWRSLRAQAEHKIQSSSEPLNIRLDPVPKMLGVLTSVWLPEGYVISFKLETDPALLEYKAKRALSNYGVRLVIGNLLSSYRHEVHYYTHEGHTPILLPGAGDIEEQMVDAIVERHTQFAEAH